MSINTRIPYPPKLSIFGIIFLRKKNVHKRTGDESDTVKNIYTQKKKNGTPWSEKRTEAKQEMV